MKNNFEPNLFSSRLVNGHLKAAMSYLAQFSDQAELYGKYVSRFQEENYCTYDIAPELNGILLAYQKYYRDAFYLELPVEEAAQRLRERLAEALQMEPGPSLDELEEKAAEAFCHRSFHALMGRTGGYYGPYIWKTEELNHYCVELPDGIQDYAVKLLDDFISKSWLDYISFGETGTGGWSNGGGLIHCVKSAYDLGSENFQVSLLKHEAQHAMDQKNYPGITNEDLEYRAKLVELIYSRQRHLLERFIGQADTSRAGNGHGLASERIVRGFAARLGLPREQLAALPIEETRAIARELFAASTSDAAKKYT